MPKGPPSLAARAVLGALAALAPGGISACSCNAQPDIGATRIAVAEGVGSGVTPALPPDPSADSPPAALPPLAPLAPGDAPADSASAAKSAASFVRSVGTCDASKKNGVQRFTLAHVNDLQARYDERIAGKSRYAYIAGYLRSLKDAGPTLVLDAGDDYEKGALAELRSAGETTRLMVQSLPIDARVIGNHDFAYGEAAVTRDVTFSSHPVLAANLRRGEGTAAPFVPYVEIDVGCVKVGIVGLVTHGYGADDEQNREPFLGLFHQDDSYLSYLYEAQRLHRGEVDVMIALTHIGRYYDNELAKADGNYDFIVGAHTEDMLGDIENDRIKNKTHAYVMQAGHYGRYIGKADVAVYPDGRVTLEGYHLVPVDESLPVADDVHDLAVQLEKQYAPDAHVTVATVKDEIPSGQAMAELVARAAKTTWNADGLLLGTDVFFDGLPSGPVTLQRVYDAVYVQKEPSGTTGFSSLYVASMTGADIAALRPKLQGPFVMLGFPDEPSPDKTYRVVVEKRALSYPTMAFGDAGRGKLGSANGRFAGEIIDLLDTYAHGQTAKGLAL